VDRYDEAVAYLREHPTEIGGIWYFPRRHAAGCLFAFLSPDSRRKHAGNECGCPTMVKSGHYEAWTPELTAFVRSADIPADGRLTRPEHLDTFAEIQRLADKTIRNMA